MIEKFVTVVIVSNAIIAVLLFQVVSIFENLDSRFEYFLIE